ncbi:MAG TPA: hypothetical protein VK914_05400 [bacterium]|jgi:hypothetical protein|nr:hypothetical protein [bacterium]
MPLVFLIVAILVLALGLVQAWTIWFLKREVQRLEFRLGEALDDEDLMEFQERLRALLSQAKETASGLAQSVDQRRESLEKSLEKAKLAEKSLALRILSKSAADAAKPGPKADPGTGRQVKEKAKPTAKAQAGPKAKPASAGPSKAVNAGPGRVSAPRTDDPAPEGKQPEPEARRPSVSKSALPTASRYQKIYDLADQGLNLEQISKESGVLAGEVDLILNLRRKEPRNT